MPDDPNLFDDSLLPDWMRDLDDDDASEEEQPASEESPAEPGVIPDWLNAARPLEEEPPAPADEGLTFEEWEQREQERLREEQKTPGERLLDEVPDWFDEVEAAEPAPEGKPPESPAEAEFVPGWALGLEDQDVEQAPDWFQDLDLSAEAVTRPVEMPEPGASAGDDTPPGGDAPDWFAGMDLPLPDDADSGEELPLPDLDSLIDVGEAGEALDWPSGAPARDDAIAGPEDIPFPDLDLDEAMPGEIVPPADVWIAGRQAQVEPDAPPPSAQEDREPEDFVERFEPLMPDEYAPAPIDEDAPAWLRDIADEGPAPAFDEAPFGAEIEPEPEAPSLASVSEDELDWLEDLSTLDLTEPAETRAEQAVPQAKEAGDVFEAGALDSDALDQLLGLYAEPDLPVVEPEPAAEMELTLPGEDEWPAAVDEEAPGLAWDEDWSLPAGPEEPQAGARPDLEALFADAAPEDQLPGAGESARPPTPQPAAAGPEPEAEPPEEPAAPGAQPEWVAELRPSDLPVTVKAGGAEKNVRQKPLSELPDRLRAFRDAALRDLGGEAPAPAPDSGPLAGVAGALPPIDAAVLPATRTPTVEGLIVTPEQQARARRLQALMDAISAEDEGGEGEASQARAAPSRRRKARFKPDRMAVALILLAALLAPFLTDALHFAADPPALTGDRLAVAAAVDALEPGDYVLFAFEYGPPSAGELDTLAEAVLRDVVTRGAVPLILSTDPLGAFHAGAVIEPLADDPALLAARGGTEDALASGEDYVTLAYLPGEAVGVRTLRYAYAADDGTPKRHPAFDATLRGDPIDLPISRVETDIGLIVVIGGESEAVRTWAEQLDGVNVPKVALVTAALEPLARPYIHEDGYAGYLAGYRDAISYDRARNAAARTPYITPADLPVDLPNPEGARWHSMTLGVAVAAGLIALGMAANSVRALRRRRQR